MNRQRRHRNYNGGYQKYDSGGTHECAGANVRKQREPPGKSRGILCDDSHRTPNCGIVERMKSTILRVVHGLPLAVAAMTWSNDTTKAMGVPKAGAAATC